MRVITFVGRLKFVNSNTADHLMYGDASLRQRERRLPLIRTYQFCFSRRIGLKIRAVATEDRDVSRIRALGVAVTLNERIVVACFDGGLLGEMRRPRNTVDTISRNPSQPLSNDLSGV